jgi:hypothetical protein
VRGPPVYRPGGEQGLLLNMKRALLLLSFAALLGSASIAHAAAGSLDERNFSVTEANQLPFTYRQHLSVPAVLQKDPLFLSLPLACPVAAKRLQLTGNSYNTQFYLFTTMSHCGWTDDAAPAWILRLSGGLYSVILSTRLQELHVRRIAYSSAMRNLAIGSVLAGRRMDVLWVFDDKQDKYVPTSFPIDSN